MPGYRLGDGTAGEQEAHLASGLPPDWNPWNPSHYLSFGYWACTFSYKDYKLSKKIEFDRRIRRMAPIMVLIMCWLSLTICLTFVDLIVIPSTYKDTAVFPWTPAPLENDTSTTEQNGVEFQTPTASNSTLNSGIIIKDSTLKDRDPITTSDPKGEEESSIETSPDSATQPNQPSSAFENPAQVSPTPKFYDNFLRLPGKNTRFIHLSVGIFIIAGSSLSSFYLLHQLGGLPSILITFIASSIIQTKVFYWLDNPYTRLYFIGARIFECCLLMVMAYRLKLYYNEILSYLSLYMAQLASLGFSLTMMCEESVLVTGTSIILPNFIILLAIPAIPLITGSLSPRDAKLRKLELYLVTLVPFCMSTLLNWWFHISWLNEIDTPQISYKNTLSIYFVGLVFAVVLVLAKMLLPFLRNRSFSWPLVLFILGMITYVGLINHILFNYPVEAPLFGSSVSAIEL